MLRRMNSSPGYHHIYDTLVRYITRETQASILIVIPYINFILILIASIYIFISLSYIKPIEAIVYGIMFFMFFECVFLILTTFITILVSGTQEPYVISREIAALMIFTLSRPYSDSVGLGYKGVGNVKGIAEIDQGSADWRGNFINFLVIGAVGFIVGSGATSISWVLGNLPKDFPANLLIGNTNDISKLFLLLFWGVVWVVISIGILNIFHKLASVAEEFLKTESANRAILFACEEAMNILEEMKLSQRQDISLKKKKEIATMLGYRLIEESETTNREMYLGSFVYKEKEWFVSKQRIVPTNQSNKARNGLKRNDEKKG